MTTSCLDRTLISNAVAGTGTNISLLMHALTPLCPKQPPPLSPPIESFANSLSLVVVGYVCGFLPWGFLALVDFISAKWKTVRATRRAGVLHLAASVFPMIFVIAYAVIQGLAGDYKEMMTAVIAVILTMFHMARTTWGLAQLREYVTWCERTLECIYATLPKSHADDAENRITELENGTDHNEDENPADLVDELMVNSDVVDNEFSGRDISISLSWQNWSMNVSNPTVCTVRWSAAFLCSLGHKWQSLESKPLPEDLEVCLASSTLFSDDGRVKMRPISLWQLAEVQFRKGSKCGAFGGSISKYLAAGVKPFKSNTFEFENIVSTYPACNQIDLLFEDVIEQNRLDARVEMVEYILASRILGPSKLRSFMSYSEVLRERFLCSEQIGQAFNLLQEQIRIEKAKKLSYRDLHSFWKVTVVPACSAIPNTFVLQSSAVSDNYESICFADSIRDENDLEGKRLVHNDVFEACSTLLKSCDFEFERYFLGVSLDCMRTLLAHWVLHHAETMNTMTWLSILPTDEIQFVASEYLCSLSTEGRKHIFIDYDGIISECQYVVHIQLLHNGIAAQNLPNSLPMIALAILSYPALHVQCMDLDQNLVEAADGRADYRIVPMLAPQNLYLLLSVNGRTGESSLRIVNEEVTTKFEWEKWINVALALMKSHNEIIKSLQSEGDCSFGGPLELIKEVDLSRPMLTLSPSEDDVMLSDLPGDLHVWTAWPIFDIRFCQFELDQWMVACGPLQGDEFGDMDLEYGKQKRSAMKTLKKISTWDRT